MAALTIPHHGDHRNGRTRRLGYRSGSDGDIIPLTGVPLLRVAGPREISGGRRRLVVLYGSRNMKFADRSDAGRRLAAALSHLKERQPVILALPRGGVAIGFEIAQALEAPLDVVLVRKIGVPWQPELAVGAVTDGATPETFIDRHL